MIERKGASRPGMTNLLRNHVPDVAAMDFLVVPTTGIELLYVIIIVRLDHRDLAWINVTINPTAERAARQITETFSWDEAATLSFPFGDVCIV